ncbi:probable receptor-like protein kinase At2g42960 isoform X3 [Lycium ferocissimum]|uniref:probable receptor-like protein kinase At2g42960 isoform X3 n=1 Tax=Lycium ferocissimum TaxID=112874 RepID=UPI0028164014|nr:probable receptor-like protein kinase At2g42960 isoform X3 [Lycium ferocissimum]
MYSMKYLYQGLPLIDLERRTCHFCLKMDIEITNNKIQHIVIQSDSNKSVLHIPEEKLEGVEETIEKVTYSCQCFAILAVWGSLIGSFLCFIKGCSCVITSFQGYFASRAKITVHLVEAIGAEIENALNIGKINMRRRKLIGHGRRGEFYQGILPSGQGVAIKEMHKTNDAMDSFNREVECLSRARHPSIVCLLGFCNEDGNQFLVYEHCSTGNLAQYFLREDTVLTWEARVKILRDCACAIKYLHHYIDGCIIHRHIKLSSILLSETLEPKLSGFGRSQMLGMEESKVFEDVLESGIYTDPEYKKSGLLTCATDVYSFGVVMLQVLSGTKIAYLGEDGRLILLKKARDVSIGKLPITEFEDPTLKGKLINREALDSILQIAVLCVAETRRGRPTIEVVSEELNNAWRLSNTGCPINVPPV